MSYNSWTLPARTSPVPQGSDEQLFRSLSPINGFVEGSQVRSVFQQSGLPSAQLATIWDTVDRDKDGKINLQEFVMAMNLIRQAKTGGVTGAFSNTQSATMSLRTGGRPYQSSSVIGTASPSLGSGGVGRGVSLSSLSQNDSWSISPEARRRYNMMFNTHDKSRTGYIGGDEARRVLTKSNLDQDTLRKIWDLSDVDKDGRLSTDEFSIAMFLTERAQKGLVPPATLPSELLPSKNAPPSPSPVFASFEDKKKANFDLGRNELERRRRMLQEEEDKAKEERERKRQAEEEQRRQEFMKMEQQRQAELERQRQLALEMDRARERAIQQAALQREAEIRELERKRKEEWAKRRQAELEDELKREKLGLETIKQIHSEVLGHLTKIELDKRTSALKLSQQKDKYTELVSTVNSLKESYQNENGRLIQKAAEAKNLQQELLHLTPQRTTVQSRLSQLSNTSPSNERNTTLLIEQCRTLSNGLTNLKVSYTQQCSQLEETKSLVNDKRHKLTNLQNDCKKLFQYLQQLQAKKHQAVVAIETRNKNLEDERRRQEEEERRKHEEAERKRQSLERAQKQQIALEENIKRQQEMTDAARKEEEKRKREEEEERRREEEEYEEKMKTLQDAKKKADEALKRQKEILAKPNPFSFFKSKAAKASEGGPLSPTKEDSKAKDHAAMKKKVAELQQRKKDLQKQQKQKDRNSTTALDDLKGLDFTSDTVGGGGTPPLVPAVAATHTPVATPSTAVVYESLEEIQEETRKRANTSHSVSTPSIISSTPTSNTDSTKSNVPKPDLPPKPVFLRHSQTQSKPPPAIPPKPVKPVNEPHPPSVETLPPKPIVPPKPSKPLPVVEPSNGDQSEEYIYEIPENKPYQPESMESLAPPPLPPPPVEPKPLLPPPATTQPLPSDKVIYDLPPPLTAGAEPLPPPVATQLLPPPTITNTQSNPVETIYDLPPDSLRPVPKPRNSPQLPRPDQVIYDLPPPPSDPTSPEPVGASSFPDPSSDPFYGNIDTSTMQDPSSGQYTDPWRSPSPDESSDAFYGNVSNPNFIEGNEIREDVPTSPLPALAYRAKYSFSATNDEEVSFIQGAVVMSCSDSQSAQNGWVRVTYQDNEGWAPLDYLQPITNTPSSGITSPEPSDTVEVLYSWEGSQPNHLSINKGDIINVRQRGEGWWMGEKDGKVGWFPGKYVSPAVSVPVTAVTTEDESSSLSSSVDITSGSQQYKATYTFEGEHDGDLPFTEGDIIKVLKKDGEWWLGEVDGRKGLFPSTYVSPVSATPDSSLQVPKEVTGSAGSSTGGTLRKLVGRVIVGFIATEENQLGLVPGQLVVVRRQEPNGWWEGQLHSRGQEKRSGWFPSNRIELLTQGVSSSPVPKTPSPSTQLSTGGLVLALYTYQATSPDELSFHKGSVLSVISKEDEEDWWKGELNGKIGLFPSNYVQPLDSLKTSDASQWSEMLNPDILAQIPSQQRKRQEAIFELIQTEKAYVHSLNLVKEVFFIPMENSAVLTQSERQQVIVNWEELIACNSSFCNSLFIRLRTSGTIIRSIGDVLIEHIPHLTPHIRWCSCQLTACTLLQSKSQDPVFREYEQACLKDTRTGGLPLSSFLLKPMQRVTKYPLLIGKILEYTPPDDLDYEPLLLALQESEKLCAQVNDGVREKENSESLEWLQSHVHLTLTEKLVFNSQTNFMGSRKLLYWGKFTKIRGNKEMVGFLFNDFFLLVRPKALFVTAAQLEPFTDNQFTMYREPFMLDQIQAKKAPVEQYGPSVFNIMLKSDKKEIPLKAESDSAREKWLKHIMDACVAYVRQHKKTSKVQRSDSHRLTLRKSSCGKLLVTVVEAADLIASSDGKSDPFCVIRVGENQEAATPVVKNNLNPHWNYTLPEFLIIDPANTTLEITVFDSDLFSPNDFLGCAKVSLKQLQDEFGGNGPWTKKLLLEDVPKGELELRITHVVKR